MAFVFAKQFEHIHYLRELDDFRGNPLFSSDTKKKEHLGLLYRDGRVYCQEAFEAFDHDFPSWATGLTTTLHVIKKA